MLQIVIPAAEMWDGIKQEFIKSEATTLQLEHSLISISKWEAKWHKSFLSTPEKTAEETLDYIRCMTLTQNVNPSVYDCLTEENFKEIGAYIDNPMTATCFYNNDPSGRKSREKVTSELIYYWMIAFNIPPEYQKWHLNRLMTLIRVCDIKNQPPKKMSKRETMSQNARLNAARRKQLNTKG